MMKALMLILVVLCIAGCAGPPEEVRIVQVVESDEVGEPDSYTIVEFPDGSRRCRFRTWGKEGDAFIAAKASGCWGWESP